MGFKKYFGPSTLITAAFIGPGTISMCSLSGQETGYGLLWVMILATFTAIIFQEMAARLGLMTGAGLGSAIRKTALNPIIKYAFIFVVISAILIGNAAYEAGNISGAVMGSSLILNNNTIMPFILGGLASVLLYFGNYKWVSRLLIGLVLIMSICFLATVILVKPNISEILLGFVPNVSHFKNHIFIIIGLIGTTVVPYNLFLHASTVSEKWDNPNQLKSLRIENRIAIILGGIISSCIIITAANVYKDGVTFEGIADFGKQLKPIFGNAAKYIMAIGFFAAGLSSAITAPLAAAYAARGLFGWKSNWHDLKFIMTWFSIIILGVIFSSLGYKPITIIQFAQIANGILLPIVAFFLLFLANQKIIMKTETNSRVRNILGIITLIIVTAIAFRSMLKVFGFV